MEPLPQLQLKKRGRPIGRKSTYSKIVIETRNGVRGIECYCPKHEIDEINGLWMPLSEFYELCKISESTGEKLIRYTHQCKTCYKGEVYERDCKNWYRKHLKSVIHRAKERGTECVGLTKLDELVRERYEEQEGKDCYSGKLMKLGRAGYKTNYEFMCIDRIDSSKGYVEGNIALCSVEVNNLKARLEGFRGKMSKSDVEMMLQKIINCIYPDE